MVTGPDQSSLHQSCDEGFSLPNANGFATHAGRGTPETSCFFTDSVLRSYWAQYGNASPLPRSVSAPGAVDCAAVPGARVQRFQLPHAVPAVHGRQLDHLHRRKERARLPVVSARAPRGAPAGRQRRKVGRQPRGHLGEVGRAVVERSRVRLCGKGDGDHPVRGGQHAHLPDQVAARRRRPQPPLNWASGMVPMPQRWSGSTRPISAKIGAFALSHNATEVNRTWSVSDQSV